jgi:hypothetical protein
MQAGVGHGSRLGSQLDASLDATQRPSRCALMRRIYSASRTVA